jgi:predicted dehydrogenase
MNIAVIGCGYWGPNQIRNFNQIPECTMKACCDLSPERLEHMKMLYPSISTTNKISDILDDDTIEAVGIATPVFTHFPIAKDCLERGKHVLIEKPLASSTAQCVELINLAKEKNRVLMVGHTYQYTAAVNKIKQNIKSGEIGEILYISSVRVNLGLFQPDINVIWDLAPHDISIINYILGEEVISVNAQGKDHFKKGIEDVASLTLNYADGAIAFIHNSWLDPDKIRKTTVVGTKKMLVYDDIEANEKIKIFDKGVDAPPHYDTFAEFQFSYRYGDILSPRIVEYEPLRFECNHFLECIRDKKTPRSDGYTGLKVVAILEASSESLKNEGKAIPVKNDYSGQTVSNEREKAIN